MGGFREERDDDGESQSHFGMHHHRGRPDPSHASKEHRTYKSHVETIGCRDIKSRVGNAVGPLGREQNKAVVVDFQQQAGGEQMVQRFVGFVILDV